MNAITTAKPVFSSGDIKFIQEQIPDILNGQLTMGPWCRKFEDCIKEISNTKYAVVFNACTSALEVGLQSLKIGADEVIVPAQTFIATAAAVKNIGATPVVCDIDPDTMCISPESLLAKITPNTRAVILVHFAGLITPDLEEIRSICSDRDIYLIEDAAHAYGARVNEQPAGSLGIFGAFSFYATKTVTSGGEGGALVTNDPKLYELARSYQSRGQDLRITDEEVFCRSGRNVHMTEMSALCGVVQHSHINQFISARNSIAGMYNAFIERAMPECRTQVAPANTVHSYWKHVLVLPEGKSRLRLKELLASRGVPINWSYYPPVHKQPVFDTGVTLPVAERICKQSVNLPMSAVLTVDQVEYVCSALYDCYQKL